MRMLLGGGGYLNKIMEYMTYQYKITIKQQLLLLAPLMLKNGILVWVYIYFFGNSIPDSIFIFGFIFFFLIDVLPTIVIHVQYLIKNFGALLIINTKMKFISYKTIRGVIEHSFDDILSVQQFASYGGSTGVYSFGEYRFYKIFFKDNTEIVITCLMMNNIKGTLETLLDVKADKHMRIIALI